MFVLCYVLDFCSTHFAFCLSLLCLVTQQDRIVCYILDCAGIGSHSCDCLLCVSLTNKTAEVLTDVTHARWSQAEKQRLAMVGMRMFLQMLFVDNFVHADLHAGNMLVAETGRLVVLDAGDHDVIES